jgi:hypothetical protein
VRGQGGYRLQYGAEWAARMKNGRLFVSECEQELIWWTEIIGGLE